MDSFAGLKSNGESSQAWMYLVHPESDFSLFAFIAEEGNAG